MLTNALSYELDLQARRSKLVPQLTIAWAVGAAAPFGSASAAVRPLASLVFGAATEQCGCSAPIPSSPLDATAAIVLSTQTHTVSAWLMSPCHQARFGGLSKPLRAWDGSEVFQECPTDDQVSTGFGDQSFRSELVSDSSHLPPTPKKAARAPRNVCPAPCLDPSSVEGTPLRGGFSIPVSASIAGSAALVAGSERGGPGPAGCDEWPAEQLVLLSRIYALEP